MDAVTLSRIQFAVTIMFHYLFPPLAIGMGAFLVFLEARYLKTKDPQFEAAAKFWTKIFALNFAIGVASGIVMEFQFGTNWAAYSRYVGDVFGAALAAEGIFAFFLESGFLALLVFGWDKVSPRVHFFSTLMVALGSIFSAIWIVVAISWQQTPAGFVLRKVSGPSGVTTRAELTDFWRVVFNPSAMDRLVHVLIGAFILGSFFIMSISAYYLLKNRHVDFARKSFTTALFVAAIASIAILFSGDSQGRVVARHQPAKLAAMEGIYKTTNEGAPIHVIGAPDNASKTVRYSIEIPGLLSFLVHRDFNKPVPGLDQFEPNIPPVALPFYSFHIMVGLGIYFIALTLIAIWLHIKGKLFENKWLLRIFVFSVIGPFIANELGWVAAEVGRQPWIVYNLLRTSDAVSPNLSGAQVAGSIVMFGVIYALLFAVWIFLLNYKIMKGPESVAAPKKTSPGQVLDVPASYSGHADSLTEVTNKK
jgi:cytochrome bd ubiquinol oxidase subunit I